MKDETMHRFREQLPRLFELKDSIADPESVDVYFQRFEENLADSPHTKEVYLRWERVLGDLDAAAWKDLRDEAAPRLTNRDKNGRGWQQLFDILGEARAYRYLKSIGCTDVHFISRSTVRTPDLAGILGSDRVLCEVKTINPSDEEVAARMCPPTLRSLPLNITTGFLRKLLTTIESATQQMRSYDPRVSAAVHFVYLNINFDDFFAECKKAYFQEIDCYLETAQVAGVRIVVHNEHTLFYQPLQMRYAQVDNDD
jgi:hypothetical protein